MWSRSLQHAVCPRLQAGEAADSEEMGFVEAEVEGEEEQEEMARRIRMPRPSCG